MRRILVLALVPALVLAVLSGCSVRTGSAESTGAWQTRADKTLGTALSSLGTARLLLENQDDGRLTRPFVVVALRDTLSVLDKEAAGFLAAQPPASRRADNDRVVAELEASLRTLNAAATGSVAAAGVRRQYDAVKALQDEVAP